MQPQSVFQALLSLVAAFPWSLSVLMMALAAMIIFRRPIEGLIGRSHEVKAGPFALKAKRRGPEVDAIAQTIREAVSAASPPADLLDARRLVIRDTEGRPRILAATITSGEPFLSLLDEDGEFRATLVASSATDPDGTAFLFFRGKDRPVTEMASFIGSLRDGTGTVVVRQGSGESIEIS